MHMHIHVYIDWALMILAVCGSLQKGSYLLGGFSCVMQQTFLLRDTADNVSCDKAGTVGYVTLQTMSAASHSRQCQTV